MSQTTFVPLCVISYSIFITYNLGIISTSNSRLDKLRYEDTIAFVKDKEYFIKVRRM